MSTEQEPEHLSYAERVWRAVAKDGYRYSRPHAAMLLGDKSIPVPPGERRAAMLASSLAAALVRREPEQVLELRTRWEKEQEREERGH